jgi:hypothetical protein
MSGDEVFVIFVAIVVGPVLWLAPFVLWSRFRGTGGMRRALAGTLGICVVLLLGVLMTLAASDVVHAPAYIFMFAVLGLAWLRVAEFGFTFAGLSLRDDVAERRNAAAMTAAAGAMIGVTLCYAGANIGDGPGWWVVVFSAAIATAPLFVCWLVLGQLTGVNDAVTIDRDPAAGLRLGACLVACGLVMGRYVAGDWESATQTVRDAAAAWPALLVILVAAAVIERVARPTAERPRAPMVALGAAPALLYLAIACTAVARLGWPE